MNQSLLDELIANYKQMPIPLWIKSVPDGRMRFLNPHYEAFFGKVSEDYVGKTDEDVWGKETAQRFAELDSEAINRGSDLATFKVTCIGTSQVLVIKRLHGDPNDGFVIGIIICLTHQGEGSDSHNLLRAIDGNLRLSHEMIEEHLKITMG